MNPIRQSGKLLLLSILVLVGCKSTQAQQPEPALLDAQSTKTREALEQTIGDLLNSQPVKLADNVFTIRSTVVIERLSSRDNQGIFLNERDLKSAESFTLLIKGKNCLLQHDQTKKMIKLGEIECRVLKTQKTY